MSFFDVKNKSIITAVNPVITFKSKRAWNKVNYHKKYAKQEQLLDDQFLFAEEKLSLWGFKSGIDGDWSIDSVTHSIDKTTGFVSSIETVKSLNTMN